MSKKSGVDALDAVLAKINKECGVGTIASGKDRDNLPVEVLCSTGSPTLNSILTIGGFPRGKIVEIYGPEASGKTSIALAAVAELQKAGEKALFVDAEHALNIEFAENLGVNTDELIICQPECGESALQIVDDVASTGECPMIVVDSVSALIPKSELDGDIGDKSMGLQARLMSQALRKLPKTCAKNGVTIIFINQIRTKIGVMFGNPETTSGGNALKFYASLRLDVRKSLIKVADDVIGNDMKVKVAKSKVGRPFQTAEIPFYYAGGFNSNEEILNAAVKINAVQKGGSWYSFNNEKLGQGRAAAVKKLDDPVIKNTIMDKIHEIDPAMYASMGLEAFRPADG